MNISLTPDVVFSFAGSWHVTSAHIALLLVSVILIILALVIKKTAKMVPTSLQVMIEAIYDWFWEKTETAFSNKKLAMKVLPLIGSFFLLILISNLFSLLPFVNSVIVENKDGIAGLFKTPTSHFSLTLALTLIALVVSHMTAFFIHPMRHIGNYIKIGEIFKIRKPADIGKVFLDLFLSILDIIGEFAKIISLSCRLFGNVLSGELMAVVIIGLSVYTQFLVPLPFFVLSIFSGLIQAVVFALLSLQYISLAVAAVEDKK